MSKTHHTIVNLSEPSETKPRMYIKSEGKSHFLVRKRSGDSGRSTWKPPSRELDPFPPDWDTGHEGRFDSRLSRSRSRSIGMRTRSKSRRRRFDLVDQSEITQPSRPLWDRGPRHSGFYDSVPSSMHEAFPFAPQPPSPPPIRSYSNSRPISFNRSDGSRWDYYDSDPESPFEVSLKPLKSSLRRPRSPTTRDQARLLSNGEQSHPLRTISAVNESWDSNYPARDESADRHGRSRERSWTRARRRDASDSGRHSPRRSTLGDLGDAVSKTAGALANMVIGTVSPQGDRHREDSDLAYGEMFPGRDNRRDRQVYDEMTVTNKRGTEHTKSYERNTKSYDPYTEEHITTTHISKDVESYPNRRWL